MQGGTAVTFLPVPWYERKMGFSLLTMGHFQYLSNVLLKHVLLSLSLSQLPFYQSLGMRGKWASLY